MAFIFQIYLTLKSAHECICTYNSTCMREVLKKYLSCHNQVPT